MLVHVRRVAKRLTFYFKESVVLLVTMDPHSGRRCRAWASQRSCTSHGDFWHYESKPHVFVFIEPLAILALEYKDMPKEAIVGTSNPRSKTNKSC